MTAPSGFSSSVFLQRAALDRLEAQRSPIAAEVMRHAIAVVSERTDAGWESSEGPVHAFDVTILVDGYAMGLLHRHPGARDSIVSTMASLTPGLLGGSAIDIDFRWKLAEHPPDSGYRGGPRCEIDPDDPIALRHGVAGLIRAYGDIPDRPSDERAVELLRGKLG